MILSLDTQHFDKESKKRTSPASLLALPPGSQAEHLLHGRRDASFCHEQYLSGVSVVEGIFPNAVDHNRRSLGTLDSIFNDVLIPDNLLVRSSLAMVFFATDQSYESHDAGIDDSFRFNSSSDEAEAKADCTTCIGETGSMVRTIDYTWMRQFLSLIYMFQLQPLTRN